MEELVIKLDLKAVREVNEQTVDRWRDVKIPPVETNYENGIKAFPSKLVANLPLSEQTPDWKTNLLPATGFSVDSPSILRLETTEKDKKETGLGKATDRLDLLFPPL
ncbi:hypothetical protein HZH68_016182 [Vespula germanica]|uniref:Uncharacterized protein n=1 Tax=Vespula germanica TaxID=30212 RepID=A0A834J4F4_VESGE|nr:hypothetical protein HZH68_016182 [Vespula germanica]